MLNQVMMVGRLTADPELQETENENKYSKLTLAVPRNYKNENGEYETDFIPVDIWNSMAENTTEYCKKGDSYEKDGEHRSILKVQADRITFLSSKAKNEPEPAL